MTQQLDRLKQGAASYRNVIAFGAAYILIVGAANLVWEIAHAPLYTIWVEGSRGDIAFAIVHCTLGDVLIAASSLSMDRYSGSGLWLAETCDAPLRPRKSVAPDTPKGHKGNTDPART